MSKKRRMIVIAGLVMAMTSATVPAIVMTGCNRQTTPANKQITGEYYDETDNFILQLYGDGYTYVMYINGVKTEGTYTFKGDNLALTIGGNIVTAKVSKNKDSITLSYNEKDYSLNQTSIRTLSFDTDGADEISSQLIADGYAGVCPDEPSKSGAIFLGWFTDNTYATPFDFDAAIYEDKTAYARFVDIDAGADNFTVTFNAGEGATVAETTATTVNGKLYKLPTPEKSGSTFVGWWVSHYGTADKLTYKYDGQVLREDTTLFAVWDTDLDGAPAVSVTSSGVTWSAGGISNQYSVVILNKDGTKVVDTTTGSLSYSYDFTTKDAGDYTVQITLNGKTTAVYFKNKGLEKASGFAWSGTTLTFDEVANATDYYLTAECANTAHVVADVHLDGPSYDFSACEMSAAGIKFTVKARAAGYAESVAEYTVHKDLAEVTGLDVDTSSETLKWNAVENATSYEVEISNGGHTYTYTVTSPSYGLKYFTGEIIAKVTAKANGYTPSAVATKNYTKNTLVSPSNIALVGENIKWDPVDGATGYVISINGTERNVSEGTQFSTNDVLFEGEFGASYAIYVKALGVSTDKNSVYSDKFTVTSGVMGDIDYSNGKVSWSGVIGAAKYGVKVNDGAETIVDDANELAVTFSKKGTNVIAIRCYSDEGVPAAWKEKNVEAFEVKLDSLGGYQIGGMPAETLSFFLAEGDELTLPTSVTKTGYTFKGWYPTEGGAADGGQKFGATATFTQDTTIYAYCTGNKYTVTINAQDGTLESEQRQFEVFFGSAFSLPVPQSNSGTTAFAGWYLEYNNSRSVKYCGDDGASVRAWNTANNNLVLYPVWVDIFKFDKATDEITHEDYYVVSGLPSIQKVTRAKVPATYEDLPVRVIEGDCFKGCKVLKTIELPDTLTNIELGEYGYSAAGSAFSGCSVLQEIKMYHVAGATDVKYFTSDGVLYGRISETGTEAQVLYCPQGISESLSIAKTVGGPIDGDNIGVYSVTTIGVKVLEGSKFNKIYLPSSITTINKNAFMSCTNLKSVVFRPADANETPAPLKIDAFAFPKLTNLKEISFPTRLADFSRAMFENDDKNAASTYISYLEKVHVSDEEGVDGVGDNYATINGVLCNKEKNKIIFAPKYIAYDSPNGEYTIPAGITTIGEAAFLNCIRIKNLTIPAYVTTIENSAFAQCTNIAKLTFEGDELSEDLSIGDFAFCGGYITDKKITTGFNNAITELTLPANLKKLGTGAFGACNKIKTVTVNCNRASADYDTDAFQMDVARTGSMPPAWVTTSGVSTVNLGKYCPEIEISGVFGTKISAVTVNPENPYYYAEDDVLYDKQVTTIRYFPLEKGGEFKIPDTVTTIGANVFAERSYLTKVIIPGSVTTIGEGAFYRCTRLAEVEFEPGTEELTIGKDAFRLCESRSLTSIVIPARCKSLGAGALRQCTYLENVTLNEGLEEIGDYAFANCYALNEISIPATCVKMGEYDKDSKLISMKVFSMESYSSKGEIANINVANDNTAFKSSQGVLYLLTKENAEAEAKATDLLVCPAGKEGAVEILPTVNKIWSNAFSYTHRLTEVTFGEGFSGDLVLGEEVFKESNLKKISLPEGLTTIVANMFKDCKSLEEIVVPKSVTSVGKAAFSGCAALSKLTFTPGGTEKLVFDDCGSGNDNTTLTNGNGTTSSIIYNCKNLKKLELPERTDKIGVCAFSGYYWKNTSGAGETNIPSALEEVILPSTLTKISGEAFCRSPKLSKLTFTDAADAPATGSLTIDEKAFYQCPISGEEITEGGTTKYVLNLPNTLKEVGAYAFQGSSRSVLTEINIPKNVGKIGKYAFSVINSLKTVTFEADSKLTEIGESAFRSCSQLATVNFDNLTLLAKIEANAFLGCGLTTLDFTNNTKLTDILDSAFSNCVSLTSVKLPYSLENLGSEKSSSVFSGCTKLSSVIFLTKEYRLKKVENGNVVSYVRIADDDTTTEVAKTEQQSNVKCIGKNCFKNTAITLFEFPVCDGNINIGDGYQFEGCKSLATIRLSRSVNEIDNLFAKCSSIENIEIASDNPAIKASTDSNVPFIISVSGTTLRYGYAAVPTAEGSVYDLSKTAFTQISARAFEGQSGIKKIILPATIQQIDEYAFANCRQLEEIEFAAGSVITTIGAHAFDGCPSLKSITIPNSVTTIGEYAFANCPALKTAKIGTSNSAEISEIGQYAFAYCHSLKSAEIYGDPTIGINTSNSTTNLYKNSYMFAGCRSLTDVTIYGKPWLGTYMFDLCTSLKTVVVNDELTKLGGYVFRYCSSLDTMKVIKDGKVTGDDGVITLPSKLTDLGHKGSSTSKYYTGYTFQGCSAITKVIMPVKLKYLGTNSFQNCTNLKTVTYIDATTSKEACKEGELILPTSIISIGGYAFDNTGIQVAKLENLGDFSAHTQNTTSELVYLFSNCANLEKVTFSNSATELCNAMFYKCSSLKTVNYFDEETKKCVGKDNEATFWEGLTYLGYASGKGTFEASAITKVIFPSTLQVINEYKPDNATNGIAKKTAASTAKVNTFKDCKNLTTVVLTKNFFNLGGYVFSGCTSLKSILLAEDLVATQAEGETGTEGGNTTTPTEVVTTLPSTLVMIGECAFQNTGITKLVLPSAFVNPKTIDEGVADITAWKFATKIFMDCVALKEIDYGYNVAAANMFQNCEELSKVMLSANLNTLGASMFNGCAELTEIKVKYAKDASEDDLKKNVDGEANLTNITTFGSSTFMNCTKLNTITLSSSLVGFNFKRGTTTHNYTSLFEGCKSLTTIKVDGDKNNEVGAANLSKIKWYADKVFLNCTGLTKVILSKDAEATSFNKDSTFKGCSSLATIFTADDTKNNKDGRANLSKITTAGTGSSYDEFFSGCAFTEVYMPNLITGGYNMFKDCKHLETVTISADLKNINYGMFDGCEALKTVYTDGDTANNKEGTANLSKITRFTTTATNTTVASYTFRNTAIEKLNLSSLSVNKGLNQFDGCTKLTEVTLGDGLTEIATGMFVGTGFKQFTIGDKITNIAAGAFAYCTDLTKFIVSGGNTTFKAVKDALYTADGKTLVAFPVGNKGEFALNEGATGAYNGALDGYAGTTKSFTLPVMNDIPDMRGLLANSGIETLIIPKGVKTIAASAFSGISTLKTVVIPSTVTSIGKAAFANCTSLETVTFTPAAVGTEEVLLELAAGTSASAADNMGVFGGCTSLKNIVIPERITNISNYTFAGSGLESVTFHQKLTEIGNYAFSKCASLKTVDIPNGLYNIGSPSSFRTPSVTNDSCVFSDCTSLTKVTLPGTLENIIGKSFAGCTALTTVNYRDSATGEIVGADGDVTFPEGMQLIGWKMFDGCTSLKPSKVTINMLDGTINVGSQDIGTFVFTNCTGIENVVLEGNLLKMATSMFSGCSNMVSIDIKTPITIIDSNVFYGCSSLTSIDLGDTVESIGSGAFSGCSSLASITIPDSVTSIGSTAFKGCTSLKKLTIPASVITLNGNSTSISSTTSKVDYTSYGVFNGMSSDAVIIIECNSLESLNYTGWWCLTDAKILFKLKGEPDPVPSATKD